MTNKSGVSSTTHNAHDHLSSSSANITTPTHSAEPASIGGGSGLQYHPGGDKPYAVAMWLPMPSKDYLYACRN